MARSSSTRLSKPCPNEKGHSCPLLLILKPKMQNWFYSLTLPVATHITAIIAMNYSSSIMETVIGFAQAVLIISFVLGLIVLIPTSIAQFLCAKALNKSNCENYQRFLIGLLNPSIAISILFTLGMIADRISA
jgi:hypothetical protein